MAARARRLTLSRRSLLSATGLSAVLLGCAPEESPAEGTRTDEADASTGRPVPRGSHRYRYGDEHGAQFAELRMPAGDVTRPSGLTTVMLLHGGYWLPSVGLETMDPLALRLSELGFATWNVEYRRTGAGGGFPTTLADVAAAVDRLGDPGLPRGVSKDVVVVGHSAGGHLAAWAASRNDRTPGGEPKVQPRGAVSLAGILDLTLAATAAGSSGPVTAFMGGTPTEAPERYALADPSRLVPASCPLWAVHADADQTVPAEQSSRYVATARAAGGIVERVVVRGDHLSVIDPFAQSFAILERAISGAAVAGS